MGLADGQAWERDYAPMKPSTKPKGDCHMASLMEDAANWRALMSSQRIRMMGRTNDMNRIGLEFWAEHSAAHPSEEYPQENCRMQLLRYVRKLRGL